MTSKKIFDYVDGHSTRVKAPIVLNSDATNKNGHPKLAGDFVLVSEVKTLIGAIASHRCVTAVVFAEKKQLVAGWSQQASQSENTWAFGHVLRLKRGLSLRKQLRNV